MTHRITVTPHVSADCSTEGNHETCTCSCGEASECCTGRWSVAEWAVPHLSYAFDPDRWVLQLAIAEAEGLVVFPPKPRVVTVVGECPCGGSVIAGGEGEDRCTRCGPVGSRWAVAL